MREVCYSWCSLFFSLLRIAQKAVDESRKEARQKAGASGRRRVTQPSGGEIRVLLACLTRLGGRRTGVEAPVMTADPTRWQLRFRLTAKPPASLDTWSFTHPRRRTFDENGRKRIRYKRGGVDGWEGLRRNRDRWQQACKYLLRTSSWTDGV